VRKVVSLEGFGIPFEAADIAPRKMARWLDALRVPEDFRPYRDMSRRCGSAAEDESAPAARQGRVPGGALGAAALRWQRGAAIRPAPQAAVSDRVSHGGGARGVARDHRARAVGGRRAIAHSALARRASRRGDGRRQPGGRAPTHAAVPQATLALVHDAGHMFHHDQPEAVARIVEPFLE
jgi:pimeloyl-ACP methyl ester carboxylesterase